jgi:hypothetical protein
MRSTRGPRAVCVSAGRLAVVALLAATLACTGLGCGRGPKLPVYPVQGQVFFKGKPAHKAVVWLHPLGPSEVGTMPPRGLVAEDGSFQVSTFRANDGAPVGHYRVTISWRTVGSGDQEGPEKLPPRYQHQANTELPTIEVKEGENVLPPFQLKD